MKLLIAAATAATVVAALATSAVAADIPARGPVMKAPAMVAPVMSWTGCFIGAGGGYGMWNQENTPVDEVLGGVPLGPQTTAGGRGYFGTVQVGCDYQFAPNWVVGAFGDWDFGSIKGTPNYLIYYGEEKLKWSWAAGGRIGYVIMPNLLGYISGGYTQAHYDQVNLFLLAGAAAAGIHAPSHTYAGWFIGTGYEYGISFLPGLFWKTEYRFADYSTDRVQLLFTANGLPTGIAVDAHKYVQTIRSELVWRFNWR